MKGLIFLICLAGTICLEAQDITFTNKTATFTNLQGQIYKGVELVKADLDGLIWRNEGGGGRICYTNLSADFLATLGIPGERIDIARNRAERKAVSDAKYRATMAAQAQAQARLQAKQDAENKATGSAKEREAQRQAALAHIQTLKNQIEETERQLNHTVAAVRDANRAQNYANDFYVVGESTLRERIQDAKALLSKMEAEYAKKYGSQ